MLYPQLNVRQMLQGLEEHIWAQRAANIQRRFDLVVKARASTKPLTEQQEWEIRRWAAHAVEEYGS
jgi:hypothetical protein